MDEKGPSVELRFQLTWREYLFASWRTSRGMALPLLAGATVAIILIVTDEAGRNAWMALLVVMAIAAFVYLYAPFYGWKHSPSIRGEQVSVFTPQSFTNTTVDGTVTVKLTYFHGVVEMRRLYLLAAPEMVLVIPKRAFVDEEQRRTLMELLAPAILERQMELEKRPYPQWRTVSIAAAAFLVGGFSAIGLLFFMLPDDRSDNMAAPADLLTLEDLQADPINNLAPPGSQLTAAFGYSRCEEASGWGPAQYRSYRSPLDDEAILRYFEDNVPTPPWSPRGRYSPDVDGRSKAPATQFERESPKGAVDLEVRIGNRKSEDFTVIVYAADAGRYCPDIQPRK